jgi:hypothetical protein
MVPKLSDPIWDKFVSFEGEIPFKNYATKMMFASIKQLLKMDRKAINKAKSIAYEFFKNNIYVAKSDLKLIKHL